MPTTGQISLLIVSVILFAVGGIVSVARLKWPSDRLRIAAKACVYLGILAGVAVLVWHSLQRHSWIPLGDNFDALIWLAMLLAIFIAYVQRVRPLGVLDWFTMPIVILLLLGAIFFGREEYRSYLTDAWSWVHRVTSYGGALAFAIAAAAGLMYVFAARKLRSKSTGGPEMGSLERLENLTRTAVTFGFALLTVGMVTGMMKIYDAGRTTSSTKIALASGVWVVYAIVLHAPINPSFRGRKTAVLSVVGFVLMIGAIVAAEMTGGSR